MIWWILPYCVIKIFDNLVLQIKVRSWEERPQYTHSGLMILQYNVEQLLCVVLLLWLLAHQNICL